ncbi:MAG: RNA polymerase sigma factor [Steroidobacteraceae bacterium]
MNAPDSEIARRIGAGDELALQYLMRRYNQTLHRTARSILKDDAEAEDAVQEAYFRAYRSIGNFRGDARLSTWLVRIVVNESIVRLRRRKRRAEVIQLGGELAAGGGEPMELPEHAAARDEARRLLETRIDGLPDAFRTVFVLRGVEDFTVEETAQALGIPEATVRTRYFRARGLLRESIAREIDGVFDDVFAFDGARCDRIVERVLERVRAARTTGT